MKKILIFILSLIFGLLLLNCGGESNNENNNNYLPLFEYEFKIKGRIIHWFSEHPLTSAEIFIQDTQYSELSNSQGDYEIELPKGTWKLKIIKEDYLEEFIEVVLDSNSPRVEIITKLKPIIIGPVFRLYQDFYNYRYITYEGVAYILEKSSGTSSGLLDIIRAYDISDWYNVVPIGIETNFSNSRDAAIHIKVDNTIWIGTGDDFEDFFLKFSLPNLEHQGHWQFTSENFQTSYCIGEKDGYLFRAYKKKHDNTEPPETRCGIMLRTFDISKGEPILESENIYPIENIFSTGFNIKKELQIIGNLAYVEISWQAVAKDSILTFNIIDPLNPIYSSREDFDR